MANRLKGKTLAITGGSQGIGLAIAQRFAEEGADISFCYRLNKPGADEVVANIQKTGRKVAGFSTTSATSAVDRNLSPTPPHNSAK
jgi:3-oxoacyl-[acyl-carrier protein] reductase